MLDKLAEAVTGEQIAIWLVIAFLVGFFIYKEFPEFRKRISSKALKEQKDEQTDRTVEQRLDNMESELQQINDKLSRDYGRLNAIEKQIDRTKNAQSDIMEELGIIMNALLGVLKGLQEKGVNGPARNAEEEIQKYLNSKAHKKENT